MTTFYYYSVYQSGLPSNTFSKLSCIFLSNESKYVANYVISFEVYHGFRGQKVFEAMKAGNSALLEYAHGPSVFRDILTNFVN